MIDLLDWADLRVAAPIVVCVGIFIRIYVGSILFHPRYAKAWNVARRIGVPLLNRAAMARFGVSIENESHADEYVTTVDESPAELSLALDTVGPVEVPLLAGFKTDWKGRTEAATLCLYHGDRPFPTAPDWFRDRQTHITLFVDADGRTVVTAHEEANSYRPDLWSDHLFKGSFSAERGVEHTRLLLQEAGVVTA